LVIRCDGADFLEKDSYVELQQLIRPYALEVEKADHLGRLTETHVRSLRIAIETCVALSQENKDLILECLGEYSLK